MPTIKDAGDLFAKCPTRSRVAIFNHEKACGFNVQWSEAGTGFGEFTVAVDKKTGEVRCEAEGMGPEWIGAMLMRLVGTIVIDVATEEPQMTITDPEVVAHLTALTEKVRRPS